MTGDFNGDGRTDLAVVDSTSNSISILLGDGDGTFQPATERGARERSRLDGVGGF